MRHPMSKPAAVLAGLAIAAGAAVEPPMRRPVRARRPSALARGSEITSAKLSVSFDGGRTWRPAAITGSNGSYAASFDAPADSLVSLRATASDANGSAVTETISNAYQVAYQG